LRILGQILPFRRTFEENVRAELDRLDDPRTSQAQRAVLHQTVVSLLRAAPLPEGVHPDVLRRLLAAGRGQTDPTLDPRQHLRVSVHVPPTTLGTSDAALEKVTHVDGFRLDLLLVTRARFAIFVEAGGYAREDLWDPAGWRWRTAQRIIGPADPVGHVHPAHPQTGVSWYEANAFTRWEGKRLPTEAEWDSAAHASPPPDPVTGMLPVGSGVQPPTSAMDLGGMVFEWCADWYDALYPAVAPRANPKGPPSGLERSARGPAFWVRGEADRSRRRRWHFHPSERRPDLGFRGLRIDRGAGKN
jgi:formylglycine-generating enzyme required for sulfatase activity